jgi:transcription initiation factor TFIID subunit 2
MAGPDGEAAAGPVVEAGIVTPEYQAACASFVVVDQDVELEINFRDRSIAGTSNLLVFPLIDGLQEITIDARQFHIDTKNILVDGRRTVATYRDPYDLLDIPAEWTLGATQHHVAKSRMRSLLPERRPDVPIGQREELTNHALGCVPADGSLKISVRTEDLSKDTVVNGTKWPRRESLNSEDGKAGIKISIPFRSKRIRDGLQFVGIEEGDTRYPHVYTRHSNEPGTASCIFPCIDDPGQRHLIKVSVKFPRTLGDALDQRLATQQPPANGSATGNRKRKPGEVESRQPQSVLIEEDKLLEMTMISSGTLTGEQDDPDDDRKKIMSFECTNAAACHVGFAVGPFEHIDLWSEFRTEEADEKLGALAAKIHGYCLPGRAAELRYTCEAMVRAADYFALEFGKYPFDAYKLCFIDDMIQDTTEVISLSLCSNRLLYPDRIIDREITVTRQLVHSLATQYFGIHIVPNKRTDVWLVVAIQWYMTDLFMKSLCGNNWYRFHLKTLSDKLVKMDVNRPAIHDLGDYLHVGDFEMDFLALKAPLVLFILDQRMSKYPGSTGVGRVISHLVSTANISNQEAKATSLCADEFRKSCAKKTQYKLDTFWQQWVKGAGCPRFLVKAKFNKKNLNVDITVVQTQGDARFSTGPRLLEKEDFWREFQEEIHSVYAGEVTRRFAGPCTVRIHEADGTPYEHYLDVREADKNGHMWVIPYNTKYKRLKRKSRKDTGNAGLNLIDAKNDPQEDDVVYFNMFGDVLQSDLDVLNWGLSDWEPNTQAAMDQESYEWIRFDCNFEWLCEIITDMPPYMYLAQLQQDRDVVAHQDAMLAFRRFKPSPMGSTIDVRTLMDRRYYSGIRSMAASDLPKHAVSANAMNNIGMQHLIVAYERLFCAWQPGTNAWTPLPNDFHDKMNYHVQCSMIESISKLREENGRCPERPRHFLFDLLAFNNNDTNEYSDQYFIARILEALTTSIIPTSHRDDRPFILTLNQFNAQDAEFRKFIDRVLDQIDSYRRQDEWELSYQNIYTITALDCKKRLMKERVIPVAPIEFMQYLQDGNIDLVRIKAFECLVEIGMLLRPVPARFMLATMSTDNSAFVRDRLFKLFCDGIAAIALAENKAAAKAAPEPAPVPASSAKDALDEDADADNEADNDGDNNGGLTIEGGDTITEARKEKLARKEDINAALKGLREDLKGNEELKIAMWRAITSHFIGLDEKRRYLEICEAMFEPEDALLLTLKYPTYWTAARAPPAAVVNGDRSQKKKCIVTFTMHYRTAPTKKPLALPVPEPAPAPAPAPVLAPVDARPPEPKKIKISNKSSFSGPPGAGRTSLPPISRTPSISVSQPRPSTDTIAVLPSIRPTAPPTSVRDALPVPTAQPLATVFKSGEKKPKPPKRKSDEGEPSNRPKKLVKGDNGGARRARIGLVTVGFRKWKALREDTYRAVKAENAARAAVESTIVATPVRRPLPDATANRISSSPTVDGSPAPRPPTDSTPRGPPSTASKPRKPLPSGDGSVRKPLPSGGERKPLPGSAPSHLPPAKPASPSLRAPSPTIRAPSALSRGPSPSMPPATTGGAGAAPTAAPTKKITLKLKVKKEPPAS